ncbi:MULTISPECIES: peptide deformylase [Anaerotruncus]|jgi:peptide deformylase|uniref:Peptide deformylase n=2 Tax=Anaerotruncus TaxID=244127 RepID=A0A498D0D0_9FIRM|nr:MULTISPECIES: peptide deformylase [Anaerotruncus]MBC3938891.1 peptide deformylase [Anaerotruncus massiliensis (ex Togo et al. 2019)]MCQ4895512.1 peptide deformylase [Anaerotruncus sp. DFI.9.16]RLL10845.1 peptide deformylase [Anaerotruncus massiliensis (ex Liu et al. 2021)]GKH48241.1 peptide deformylase [Oscillospiraceae bacterium]
MALRTIIKEGDERLRKKSRPVTEFNERLWTLLDDMYETMKGDGVGIAAPQVGILRRAVVIDVGEGRHELVNPEIVEQEGDQYGGEGCLSVPGQYGMVHRPQKLRVRAQDRYGKPFELEAEGYLAVAVCHETDHLDGVLFIDKADRMLDPEELEETE